MFFSKIDNIIDKLFKKALKQVNPLLSKYLKYKKVTPTNLDTNLTWIDRYTKALEEELVRNIVTITDKEIEAFSKDLGIEIPRIEFLRDIKNNTYNLVKNINSAMKKDIIEYLSLEMVRPSTKLDLISLSEKLNKSIKQTQNVLKETNTILNRDFINKQHLKLEKNFEVKYFYLGPVDGKMSDFCKRYVGQSKTRAEWEAIKSDIFTHGGHFGCRHYFVVDSSSIIRRKK